MESDVSALVDAAEAMKERPNFKCSRYGCYHRFYLSPRDKKIWCPSCGYRILDKLRTRNYITYKTI